MSRMRKTDGDWLNALEWRKAKATGNFTLVAEGHKQKKNWEFKLPSGEIRCIDAYQYNELAGIHFHPEKGWIQMTQDEFCS